MYKLILPVMLGLLLFFVSACDKGTNAKQPETQTMTKPTPAPAKSGIIPQPSGNPGDPTPPTLDDLGATDEVAVLETSRGEIVCEFYPDYAPWHVANFKKLVKTGFYDGTYFHRVLPGFVVQGGDPNTKDDDPNNDGMGGPPWSVRAEFNELKHDKGILSMARAMDPNSAGSQFFICLTREKTAQLDNQYTVFGKVIKGLDIVDAIGAVKRDPQNPKDRTLPAVTLKSAKLVKRSTVQ